MLVAFYAFVLNMVKWLSSQHWGMLLFVLCSSITIVENSFVRSLNKFSQYSHQGQINTGDHYRHERGHCTQENNNSFVGPCHINQH